MSLMRRLTVRKAVKPTAEVEDPPSEDVIAKQGMLTKVGGKNKMGAQWQKRHFVLTKSGKVSYYDNQRNLKGSFDVADSVVTPVSGNKKEYCFSIATGDRTYFMFADNEKEMHEWIDALQLCGAKKMHSDIVKEGTLSKEGEVNSAWQQRHFVLGRDKELKYYKGVALKGSIRVENATILVDTGKQKNNSFGIQTPSRTYYLSASTTAEMQEWMDKLVQEGGAVLPTEQTNRRASVLENSMLEGYLLKEGGKSKSVWQTRYFVLTHMKTLRYYSKKGGEGKGVITFSSEEEPTYVRRCPEKRDHCFAIETQEKTYYMCCENENMLEEWLRCLKNAGAEERRLIEEDNIAKEGYAWKESRSGGKWAYRYFTLTKKREILYFKKRNGELKGSFACDENTVLATNNTKKEHVNCFTIETAQRTMCMSTDTPQERDLWMQAIAEACGCQANSKRLYGQSDVVQEGHMFKSGEKNSALKNRYFVLARKEGGGANLHYFTRKDGELKGSCEISNESTVARAPQIQKKCFTLTAQGREYTLFSIDDVELTKWIKGFVEVGATDESTIVHEQGDDEIMREGELRKRGGDGGNKPYKKRFFELTKAGNLKYYDKKDGSLKGSLKVTGSSVCRTKHLCFQVGTEERTLKLQTDAKTEMLEWIDAFVAHAGATYKESVIELEEGEQDSSDEESSQKEKTPEGDEIQPQEEIRIRVLPPMPGTESGQPLDLNSRYKVVKKKADPKRSGGDAKESPSRGAEAATTTTTTTTEEGDTSTTSERAKKPARPGARRPPTKKQNNIAQQLDDVENQKNNTDSGGGANISDNSQDSGGSGGMIERTKKIGGKSYASDSNEFLQTFEKITKKRQAETDTPSAAKPDQGEGDTPSTAKTDQEEAEGDDEKDSADEEDNEGEDWV